MTETEDKQEITRIGAYGLVTQGERILLCRLSAIVTGNAGKWTLPGGGIDFGEDPAVAVQREIAEETGLQAQVGELADIHTSVVERETTRHHGIRIIYHISAVSGELRDETDGSTDTCAWFAFAAARELPLVPLAEHGLLLLTRKDSP